MAREENEYCGAKGSVKQSGRSTARFPGPEHQGKEARRDETGKDEASKDEAADDETREVQVGEFTRVCIARSIGTSLRRTTKQLT